MDKVDLIDDQRRCFCKKIISIFLWKVVPCFLATSFFVSNCYPMKRTDFPLEAFLWRELEGEGKCLKIFIRTTKKLLKQEFKKNTGANLSFLNELPITKANEKLFQDCYNRCKSDLVSNKRKLLIMEGKKPLQRIPSDEEFCDRLREMDKDEKKKEFMRVLHKILYYQVLLRDLEKKCKKNEVVDKNVIVLPKAEGFFDLLKRIWNDLTYTCCDTTVVRTSDELT